MIKLTKDHIGMKIFVKSQHLPFPTWGTLTEIINSHLNKIVVTSRYANQKLNIQGSENILKIQEMYPDEEIVHKRNQPVNKRKVASKKKQDEAADNNGDATDEQ